MSELHDIENLTIDNVGELKQEVKDLVGNPLSTWAVAATIESLGVREVDVREDFGYESIFELADEIYDELKQEAREEQESQTESLEEKIESPSLWEQLTFFLRHYGKGLLFSLPMISQIAAVIVFRYSLWAWLEFNEAQATVVAFGTITAFVLTGGFIQVLGRSVSSYKSSDNFYLAYESTKQVLGAGVITVGVATVALFLINLLIPFYPNAMITLGLVYMILISLLLLASGVLYALERQVSILVIIILGTLIVLFNMEVLNLGIYLSQWIAMAATILLLAGYAYLVFNLKIRSTHQGSVKQTLPKPEVRYYVNYRYFIYGLGYFLFLFVDRILAWSAGPPPPPYIIWFNTPYELGMDWALLTLVLSVAVLEYSIQAFSKYLVPLQEKAKFNQLKAFNDYYRKFYFRQLALLIGFSIVSILLTYFAVDSLRMFQNKVPEIRDFFANPMTTKVFWLASISYVFLNIGLLNALFFFTLNKPAFSMYSMLAGLTVNFFVGFICSRVIALEYATIGLMAGSICFAVVSGLFARKFFKRLDYYYYSAF